MKTLVPALALLLAACGSQPETNNAAEPATAEKHEEGVVALTPQQIATAGIELVSPTVGGSAGAIELPATIEGDPDATQVVSAAIGGRIVSLTRNLGQSVRRGQTLAVIESREAAQMKVTVRLAQLEIV